jgi:predicted ATPase
VARPFLERLKLSGYKSIREAEIEFTRLNVLIGANGAGKSNLVSFFSLLSAALGRQVWMTTSGGMAGRMPCCTFGAQRTSEIAVAATVRTVEGTGVLYQRLGFRAPDSLFYRTPC